MRNHGIYIGRPCKTCGKTRRYCSTGNCVDCAKEYQRRRYAANAALFRRERMDRYYHNEVREWLLA